MAVGYGYAILATSAVGTENNQIIIVCAIIGAAGIIFGGIWRLVKATYTVAATTKDNTERIKDLSTNIADLRQEMVGKITVSQHEELLIRVAALEKVVMIRDNPHH